MTERRLRWGLLSTARINQMLIPHFRSANGCELLAVGSSSQLKAEQYAHTWTIPRAYGSYEGLLADPDVDAVYISLPNIYHAEWTIRCARAGKHILCEKPLALSVEEVDRMADAARQNGVILQEAAMYRFHPQTLKVRELVRQGAIGDLRFIRGIFHISIPVDPGDIRFSFNSQQGGGSLWDLGLYPLGFARFITGAEPAEVFGCQEQGDEQVDLTFAGLLRFPAGVLAQISSSFQMLAQWEVELLGTQGIIHLDTPYLAQRKTGVSQVRIFRGDPTVRQMFGDSREDLHIETLTYDRIDPYGYEVEGMTAAILDGHSPVIPLEESRANVAALTALHRSARENRPIRL
jgi:predicted dehydrogenase